MQIGAINMRALEVYSEVKKEYDIVQDKVNTLEKEIYDSKIYLNSNRRIELTFLSPLSRQRVGSPIITRHASHL